MEEINNELELGNKKLEKFLIKKLKNF